MIFLPAKSQRMVVNNVGDGEKCAGQSRSAHTRGRIEPVRMREQGWREQKWHGSSWLVSGDHLIAGEERAEVVGENFVSPARTRGHPTHTAAMEGSDQNVCDAKVLVVGVADGHREHTDEERRT